MDDRIFSADAYKRFISRVDVSGGPHACHPWTGHLTADGYGHFRIAGKLFTTARWLLGYHRGAPLTRQEFAIHRDSAKPACCNERHLYVGTRSEYIAIAIERKGVWQPTQTHCKNGHEFTPESTYIYDGRRHCNTCRKERSRRRYENEGEELREYFREYQRRFREEHPDVVKARMRRWREENRERVNDDRRRYYARKRAALVERFSAEEIYERDGWQCQLCGKKMDPELRGPDPMAPSLDHIIPLSQGGDHSRLNSQAAHYGCNSRKGNRSVIEDE